MPLIIAYAGFSAIATLASYSALTGAGGNLEFAESPGVLTAFGHGVASQQPVGDRGVRRFVAQALRRRHDLRTADDAPRQDSEPQGSRGGAVFEERIVQGTVRALVR